MTRRILVVDDEKDIVDLISYNLEKEGFSVIKAYDGEAAIKLVNERKQDLMILDLMLPGIQGIDVCKLIRGSSETGDLPIIMLTAKGDEFDRVLGLEIGADDYITKPFSVKELVARIRTVLRRTKVHKEEEPEGPYSYKELTIDRNFHSVTVRGHKVDLSPTEFRLLAFLAEHPGRVYSRDQLLDNVWGDEAFVEPRTVDVHIRRLRSQIEDDSAHPQYIVTVRGFGYKFADS